MADCVEETFAILQLTLTFFTPFHAINHLFLCEMKLFLPDSILKGEIWQIFFTQDLLLVYQHFTANRVIISLNTVVRFSH
jgi:hypothetical protein